jgi:hypothetical protein
VLGYLGFIVAPPTIGFVAQSTSLPIALGGVAAVLGIAALMSRAVAPVRVPVAT